MSYKNTKVIFLNCFVKKAFEDQADISEPESEQSMREAKQRLHSLLDDTFTSLKKYQKKIGKMESESMTTQTPQHQQANTPQSLGRSSATPQPQGASSDRNSFKKRNFPPHQHQQQQQISPYMMPPQQQYPQYPMGYPDPMLTWDPMERQRYI